jgi:hypothetical protein
MRNAFINAMLAEAGYVTGLTPGMTGDELTNALKRLVLPEPLAEYLAQRFSVVRQTADLSSGFAVTVFRENASGQRYISFRGTEELPVGIQDWVADTDIALGSGLAFRQVVAMANWVTVR